MTNGVEYFLQHCSEHEGQSTIGDIQVINTGRATDRIQTLISSLLTEANSRQTDRLTSADRQLTDRQTEDRPFIHSRANRTQVNTINMTHMRGHMTYSTPWRRRRYSSSGVWYHMFHC